MSAAAQIDYGSHAPAGAGIDYGAHGPADSETKQGWADQLGDLGSHAWDMLVGAAKGIVHPIDAISAILKNAGDNLQAGKAAWEAGDKSTALARFKEAVPVLGPVSKQMREEADKGQIGAEGGDLLGFLVAGKLGSKAIETVPGIPELPSKVRTAARIATDPEVVRETLKVLPKGSQTLKAYDLIKSKLAPTDPQLDAIAQKLGLKNYAEADEATRETINAIAKNAKPEVPINPPTGRVDIGNTAPQSTSAPLRPGPVPIPQQMQPGSVVPVGNPLPVQPPALPVSIPQSGSVPQGPLARAPLRPPLAEVPPTLPPTSEAPPAASRVPLQPPVSSAANAYTGGENAPSAPEAGNRATVADKIGTALVKAGITTQHLDQVEALPASAARKFWEAAGVIHKEGYVPSASTIDSIRAVVKAKEPNGPQLVVKPGTRILPKSLQGKPQSVIDDAITLSDLMNEGGR